MFTLSGKTWKDGNVWLIEVPALDLMTQGKSQENALDMIKDAIESLINVKSFNIDVRLTGRYDFEIVAEGHANMSYLIALLLKRLRAKSKLSLEDMRKKLHVKSRTTYAQYERANIMPGLDTFMNFLHAMGFQTNLVCDVTAIKKTAQHVKYRR